jgi:hypothetical protein
MRPRAPSLPDESDARVRDAEAVQLASEDDLWFLPGPMDDAPDYLPPGPRADLRETDVLDDWRRAEAGHAARLARVAGRIGALDERLKRGPEGWRHRLALSREMLKCRAASRWLMPSAQASRALRYKSTVKILPPSLQHAERT